MNKAERTYVKIRQRIVKGEFGPGQRLVLDALARELGVSTVPVREAVRRLEAEGWVVYRRNAGAHVAPVDDTRWEDEMRTLALLEGHATALAAPYFDDEGIETLRKVNRTMREALQQTDVLLFSQLNRDFHLSITERCPNAYLLEVWSETRDRLDALRQTVFIYIPKRGSASIGEHDRLVDLIEQEAPLQHIERVARRHKLATVEAFLETRAKDVPTAEEVAG